METAVKHYKFVNSKTGNTIYYYSISKEMASEDITKQLELIRAEVAMSNGVFLGTIYWEEIKEE
ncbi:hypothetical protein [Mucilaginibacter sp.]